MTDHVEARMAALNAEQDLINAIVRGDHCGPFIYALKEAIRAESIAERDRIRALNAELEEALSSLRHAASQAWVMIPQGQPEHRWLREETEKARAVLNKAQEEA